MHRNKIEIVHLSEIFDGVKQDLKDRTSSPKLPTGLEGLDKIIWGLHKKELMTIGARPSEGKTALAGQIAFNLADNGHNVLFISLEMSKEQIVERLFCLTCKIHNAELREGRMSDYTKSRIETFEKLIEHLPMLIVDNCGYTFEDVEKLVAHMNPRPDVVILDYIQLVSYGGYSSQYHAITEYFRKLKELAKKYNCAMVVLSQIRRMDERRQNRRPTMDELKGSGSLEEHSDTIALLYWISHNEPSYLDRCEFEVHVAKQRHGTLGMVTFNFQPHFFAFENRENTACPI